MKSMHGHYSKFGEKTIEKMGSSPQTNSQRRRRHDILWHCSVAEKRRPERLSRWWLKSECDKWQMTLTRKSGDTIRRPVKFDSELQVKKHVDKAQQWKLSKSLHNDQSTGVQRNVKMVADWHNSLTARPREKFAAYLLSYFALHLHYMAELHCEIWKIKIIKILVC